MDADTRKATEDWPAAPDQAHPPGDNPSQPPRSQPPIGRISLDPQPQSGHQRAHPSPAPSHPGAAQNSPEHDSRRRANETKMAATQRQPRPDQRLVPSTDHVQTTTHDQHAHPSAKTTTNPENCADHDRKENPAPAHNQARTETSRTAPAESANSPHGCRTLSQRHPHQQAQPTPPTSAHLKAKHRAPESMRKTRAYPRFNENAPTSVRTDTTHARRRRGRIASPLFNKALPERLRRAARRTTRTRSRIVTVTFFCHGTGHVQNSKSAVAEDFSRISDGLGVTLYVSLDGSRDVRSRPTVVGAGFVRCP
ncbi:Uncharacterised protein [Mycobacteroides abscessus subsp. massiliense]|nr:Uncharacterised protein [Mycobacteroides abscessus subsp. massiliense]SKU41159.1 Uncharacterised protein [Mycobacteroides abscessus subsp. massiliense]